MLNSLTSAYTITPETFETLNTCWQDRAHALDWNCLFVLPGWLKAWWHSFGTDSRIFIRSVRYQDKMIGIAPLCINGTEAAFIGDIDVCDYQDFIIAEGKEKLFYASLLDHLAREGFSRLNLQAVRPESTVMAGLKKAAKELNRKVSCQTQNVALQMKLADSWDAFLGQLNGKQRHEIRRKLRRLHEAGQVRFRSVEGVAHIHEQMTTFLALFKSNRFDKVGIDGTLFTSDTFVTNPIADTIPEALPVLCTRLYRWTSAFE